uniref:RxLR effector candidate protein n=1 Tax=Hyaloperonospora arabidopsidis (strain Emoy2) TaxID=559515 RepID=M4C3J4_HYAAE
MSLLIAVVQQAFHEEVLATARINQSMRRRRKHLERVTCELREDLEHERSRRLDLIDNVTRLSLEREKNRSDFAFAQLENERAQRSLRGDISELQTRADSQHREHKYLLEMLERKGFLHRKKSRTGDTA